MSRPAGEKSLTSDAAGIPPISVVVGAKNAGRTISACLQSLLAQTQDAKAEIIVVDASYDGTADIVAADFPQVTLIRNTPDLLVPALWKQGLDNAQAPIIAFTIGQCVPVDDWLRQIMQALVGTAVAVGGPLAGPEDGSVLDWGLYFSRYSRFLPPGLEGAIDDVAGDNAAYKKAALDQCYEVWQGGFWENLVNARLLANGETLLWEPKMVVIFGSAEKLGHILRNRFRHGRHYASTRLGNTLPKRLIRTATAPLLLPLLLSRIYRRVRQERPDWLGQFWRSLPVILAILASWSAGEMSGYVIPKRPKK